MSKTARLDLLMALEGVADKSQQATVIAETMKDPSFRRAFLSEVADVITVQPEDYESVLVALMHAHSLEYGVSLSEALIEIGRQNPALWRAHSERVMKPTDAETTVVPID